MSIPFTQYLRPRGEPTSITIDRPAEVEAQARAIIAAGMRFEAEVLSDERTVSLTVFSPAADKDIAIELMANGPDVPATVDRLVATAYRYFGFDERDALDDLARKASAAKIRGPWEAGDGWVYYAGDYPDRRSALINVASDPATAEFIAACTPDVILALLEHRRDAARYRFLRDNPLQLRAIDGNASFHGQWTAEQFDGFTDAAIEEVMK